MSDFMSSPYEFPETTFLVTVWWEWHLLLWFTWPLAWGPKRLLFPGPKLVKGDMIVPAEKFHSKQRSCTNCNPDPE